MAYKKTPRKKIFIPEAELQWRPNFSGNPEMNYNKNSKAKNFTVVVKEGVGYKYGKNDLKIADLEKDGINVKYTKPKDKDEVPVAYLQVKVNFNGSKPPTVIQATKRNKILLDDATVGLLDDADITSIHDMYLTLSAWEMKDGKTYDESRKSVYLDAMFVEIEDNPFIDKYADVITGSQNGAPTMEELDEEIPF